MNNFHTGVNGWQAAFLRPPLTRMERTPNHPSNRVSESTGEGFSRVFSRGCRSEMKTVKSSGFSLLPFASHSLLHAW
jgi:hypothetical protein